MFFGQHGHLQSIAGECFQTEPHLLSRLLGAHGGNLTGLTFVAMCGCVKRYPPQTPPNPGPAVPVRRNFGLLVKEN
jgi:hypothetical protein